MKNKYVKILFSVLIIVILIVLAFPFVKSLIFNDTQQGKDYSVIAINDNDKTLLGTLNERKQLKYVGYEPQIYSNLDALSKKVNIKTNILPEKIASFLILAAYKAEKQAYSGKLQAIKNFAGRVPKMLTRISKKGYPATACTYVFCVLQSIERILTQKKLHIDDDFYSKLNKSLEEMDSIVVKFPHSKTNNFKENTLLEIRICLILLNIQQYKQQYAKYPDQKALKQAMSIIPSDPYRPNSQLIYNSQGPLWYIKSVGKNSQDDGYDAIKYCPLPIDYSFNMPKDIVISSKTRSDLKKLWTEKKLKNAVVSIRFLGKNGMQVEDLGRGRLGRLGVKP